jgi:hypothetical protein
VLALLCHLVFAQPCSKRMATYVESPATDFFEKIALLKHLSDVKSPRHVHGSGNEFQSGCQIGSY